MMVTVCVSRWRLITVAIQWPFEILPVTTGISISSLLRFHLIGVHN